MAKPASFAARTTTDEVELGTLLQPKFGPDGLIPCITVDHATGEVLMFAFMNAESLSHTIRTRTAAFWSRSRNKLWVKGEQSVHALKVVDLYVACDHGYRSCFYRKLAAGADLDGMGAPKLEFAATRAFDPAGVYKK